MIEFNDFKEIMYEEFEKSVTDEILHDVFEMFDTDKDGFLSPMDVQAVYRKLGIHLTPCEASEFMYNCDCDVDGLITFDEFKVYYKKKDRLVTLLEESCEQLGIDGRVCMMTDYAKFR